MKALFPILAALSLILTGASLFADQNLDSPDALQKNSGPGNLDASTPALNKKAGVVPAPTPSPVPKAPEKKKSAY